jgi:hypothetical protein
MTEQNKSHSMGHDAQAAAERLNHARDAALGHKDLDSAMKLYVQDASLESPLVCHLLGQEIGIIHGVTTCVLSSSGTSSGHQICGNAIEPGFSPMAGR